MRAKECGDRRGPGLEALAVPRLSAVSRAGLAKAQGENEASGHNSWECFCAKKTQDSSAIHKINSIIYEHTNRLLCKTDYRVLKIA